MSDLTERFRRFATAFPATKLYAQIMVASAVTVLGALLLVVPVKALAPLRSAVVWTVSNDYDFGGQAQRVQTWVSKNGGWIASARGVWEGLAGPFTARNEVESTGRVHRPAVSVTRVQKDPTMPVQGPVLLGFGWTAPGGAEEFHQGLDLAVPVGTQVVASADGIIMEVRLDEKLGRLVEINHGQVIGIYAQLGAIQVVAGQSVAQGQRIGLVGTPIGGASGLPAHLHFEVRTMNGRVPIDPAAYLGLGGRKL